MSEKNPPATPPLIQTLNTVLGEYPTPPFAILILVIAPFTSTVSTFSSALSAKSVGENIYANGFLIVVIVPATTFLSSDRTS